jgi:nicotinate-nucleotide adenylyltransferase
MNLLAFFGGTFDPVHYGHLRCCHEVAEAFAVEKVFLLPSAQPPAGKVPGASAEQRLAMLDLALAQQHWLQSDGREMDRTGPSYTIDTLKELRAQHGPDRPLAWVIGADQYAKIDRWKDWQKLIDYAHLIVMTRPGSKSPPHQVDAFFRPQRAKRADFANAPAGFIAGIETTSLAISSTEIRRMMALKRSPRYLLPDPVIQYIRDHDLYRISELSKLVQTLL